MATQYKDRQIINGNAILTLPDANGTLASDAPFYKHRLSFAFKSDACSDVYKNFAPICCVTIDADIYSQGSAATPAWGGIWGITWMIRHLIVPGTDNGWNGTIRLKVHGWWLETATAVSHPFTELSITYNNDSHSNTITLWTNGTGSDNDCSLEALPNNRARFSGFISGSSRKFDGSCAMKDICKINIRKY